MLIKIDPNIKRVEFWAVGPEIPKVTGGKIKRADQEVLIHSFINPRLLVDNAAISCLPSVKRDIIVRLLEFPDRLVEYDGVSLAWSDAEYPNVWAPSIDTALFAKALHYLFRTSKYYQTIRSFLEIGCGSGFLSKYILAKKRDLGTAIEYAHLMDINRDALACALDNIEPIRGNTLISYSLNSPNKMIKVMQPYDLVLCNPPYIPRPHAKADNPFEGLFLYGEILKRAHEILKPGGRLITNFSSLSKKELLPVFKKIFSVKTIYRMRIPLKLPLLTAKYSDQSRKWMNYLERNQKLILDSSERSGYRYWQNIEIVECTLL